MRDPNDTKSSVISIIDHCHYLLNKNPQDDLHNPLLKSAFGNFGVEEERLLNDPQDYEETLLSGELVRLHLIGLENFLHRLNEECELGPGFSRMDAEVALCYLMRIRTRNPYHAGIGKARVIRSPVMQIPEVYEDLMVKQFLSML